MNRYLFIITRNLGTLNFSIASFVITTHLSIYKDSKANSRHAIDLNKIDSRKPLIYRLFVLFPLR